MTNSAEARVVAAFTFLVVFLMSGWSQLSMLLTQIAGAAPGVDTMSDDQGRSIVIIVIAMAVAALAAWVAQQAGAVAEQAWARHLAGASLILGAVGVAAGLLRIVATLAR